MNWRIYLYFDKFLSSKCISCHLASSHPQYQLLQLISNHKQRFVEWVNYVSYWIDYCTTAIFVACTYCAAKVRTEISLTLCSMSFHTMHDIAIALPASAPGVSGGVSSFPHKFNGFVWRSVFPRGLLTTCHGQHPLKRGLKLWHNERTANTTLFTSYIHRKMKKRWRSSLILFSQIWLYTKYEIQILNHLSTFLLHVKNQV